MKEGNVLIQRYKAKLKTGDVFGELTAIKYVGHRITKKGLVSQWLFMCSCGRESIKDDIQVRREHTKRCNKGCHRYLGKGIALENKLYDTYKRHAIDRNIEFEITKEDFINLTKLNCEYCDISPLQKYRSKHQKLGEEPLVYNGVDRIDNMKGYTKDNCITACKRCNQGKNNMSIIDFRNWIKNIIETKSKILFNEQ